MTAAAQAAARIGATVLLEPVSGPKPYPLRTASDVVSVLDRVVAGSGVTNVGFLCDLFHLANNGDDLDRLLDRYNDRIAHVQIADHLGRHEPGRAPSTWTVTCDASKTAATRAMWHWSTSPPARQWTALGGSPGAPIPFPQLKS